jgi:excisionase family DNA binding protein
MINQMTQGNTGEEIRRMNNGAGVRSESEVLLFENYIATDRVARLNHLHWMTTVEAAQYLRVSVGSIKNMVYRGRLSPKKLGRLNRFLKDDLDRTLKSPFSTKGAF